MKIRRSIAPWPLGRAELALAAAALLIGIGVISLMGAAANINKAATLLAKEAAWLLFGSLGGFLLYRQPLSVWLRCAPWLYSFSMALTAAALLLPDSKNSFPISQYLLFNQVAELPALPVMLLTARLLQGERSLFLSLKGLAVTMCVAAVPIALLSIRRGDTIVSVYVIICFMSLLAVNLRLYVWMMLAFAADTAFMVMWLLRNAPFICPFLAPPYELPLAFKMIYGVKSKIALSSGGLFGRGLGQSELSLCEGFADLHHQVAFAFFGEQFGFFGVTLVLSLFAFLALNCLWVARRAEDRGQCFIAASFGWFLAWHVFMHAGAIIWVAPAMGFSLPFFPSGPATVAFMAMLAILLRIMKYETRCARSRQ